MWDILILLMDIHVVALVTLPSSRNPHTDGHKIFGGPVSVHYELIVFIRTPLILLEN